MKKKIRVGLLFGGRSTEHSISIESARAIYRSLDPKRYLIRPILIGKEGEWLAGPPVHGLLKNSAGPEKGVLSLAKRKDSSEPIRQLDVVFPVFHGPFGEDGTVQGLLELLDVPYVGSGVLASALGMDKVRSRTLFRAAGLPVPKTVQAIRPSASESRGAARRLGYPLVVKPNRAGSSIGVSIVSRRQELPAAVATAGRFDPLILFEAYVAGRELTVSVLGSARPRALPVIEIIPKAGFFDLRAKYRGVAEGETQELCPAPVTKAIARQAQALALRAHQTLGCRGLTRTDFRLRRSGQLVVLETNTMPGFTENSLAPKAVRVGGISFPELLNRLIQEALAVPRPRRLPQ